MRFGVLALLFAPTGLLAQVIDFEDTAPGGLPAGQWAVEMTHAGEAPQWEIVRDSGSPAGPNVLAQLSHDPAAARFPLAIYEDALLTNGEIRVSFKPVSGRIDQAAGLLWRYIDENNYYVARANALEDNVVLYKVEDAMRFSLSPVGRPGEYGVKHTVADGRWSTLSVSFIGSRFTVFIDGRELFQVEDATFREAGKVGLWTKGDSVTYFDAFEVTDRTIRVNDQEE